MTSPPTTTGPPPTSQPLDNAVWHALGADHAHVGETRGRARRYRPDVAVFAAIPDVPDEADWLDLAALVGPGGAAVLFRVTMPAPPAGWEEVARGVGDQMVLRGGLAPAPVPPHRALGPDDVPLMLDLVARTRPGPFREATVTLGGYLGVFDGPFLVAMAGQRIHLDGCAEISAVCTDPAFRGRGLAAGLTTAVAQAVLARGEQPFLHHAADNDPARRVYERLGFAARAQATFATFVAPR